MTSVGLKCITRVIWKHYLWICVLFEAWKLQLLFKLIAWNPAYSQKCLLLWFTEERESCGFGITWVWLNVRILILRLIVELYIFTFDCKPYRRFKWLSADDSHHMGHWIIFHHREWERNLLKRQRLFRQLRHWNPLNVQPTDGWLWRLAIVWCFNLQDSSVSVLPCFWHRHVKSLFVYCMGHTVLLC